MNALAHLAALLSPAVQAGARDMPPSTAIDAVIAEMEAKSKSRRGGHVVDDHLLDAVKRFWQSQEIQSFRDAYMLSWGLCLPHQPLGPCVLEDRPRLQKVLDGVDEWRVKPSAYRRCYQGLVKSYFTYDALAESTPRAGRNNWRLLRDYLQERNGLIRDKSLNPEWVDTAVGNRLLFGDQPCEPYVDALLRGDSGAIDHLCEQLGINKASWFLRELVLAQVKGATSLGNGQFQALLPRLLDLLAANDVLRDRGMVMVLDRYANVPGTALHQGLRDKAVAWWGNPWLPSHDTEWGGVTQAARTMVADWLKLEFIETFFTKLAEDGLGDPRRMNFWKRYVKSIDHIEFALGSTARNSRERDMTVLRGKMKGLLRALDANGTNNAFIMWMGPLVAVEFSGLGNAFYGYDARQSIPFDTTKLLRLEVNGSNSLKHRDSKSILRMSHKDGIHNWDKWEDMFAATLRSEFSIEPSAPAPRAVRAAPTRPEVTPPAPQPTGDPQQYSRSALQKFTRDHGLEIDDKTSVGGSLWVRTDASNEHINAVLTRWGFRNKPGKGWWK
ncbi:EH signature domain-containing protein [Pelomonas sp. SE-A7]|uniref:EH signature domain-containing protein n=1 Tax=Pelomonas sp. SE-A7 TaxID=3054953 RepID=UPI00259CA741|nr:EH signature domain-containing protein [Pelomonas sp. SE-A7]MDM4765981.1 EH signature domain-containing protein [Pelomonas sp. SE-A7]